MLIIEVNIKDIKVGDLTVSRETMEMLCGGERIKLTAKEFAIIEQLASNSGKVVSKEALYFRAWGQTTFVEGSYVFAYISYLRNKLKKIGSKMVIKSVRRAGYQLVSDGGDDV